MDLNRSISQLKFFEKTIYQTKKDKAMRSLTSFACSYRNRRNLTIFGLIKFSSVIDKLNINYSQNLIKYLKKKHHIVEKVKTGLKLVRNRDKRIL